MALGGFHLLLMWPKARRTVFAACCHGHQAEHESEQLWAEERRPSAGLALALGSVTLAVGHHLHLLQALEPYQEDF